MSVGCIEIVYYNPPDIPHCLSLGTVCNINKWFLNGFNYAVISTHVVIVLHDFSKTKTFGRG